MGGCLQVRRWLAVGCVALLLPGCGLFESDESPGTVGGAGGPPPAPVAPTLVSAAPEPALPVGIDPVPAVSPTPMRLTGTTLPVSADPSLVTIRLTAPAFVFFGGTSTSLETSATASTATTVDFVAPPATLVGVDSVLVAVTALFPDGTVLTLPSAFTYLSPAVNVVTTTERGLPGASGVLNPTLAAGTPSAPIHLFARAGGDPFLLNPAPGRTFGPLPVPPAGTGLGVVDVVLRTPGAAVWPGGHDSVTTTGELVSNGTFWEIRGTMPGDLSAPSTGPAALDASVSVVFEDGGIQTLPASPAGDGARLVRTTQRVFVATSGGLVRAFGQDPGIAGVSVPVDGDPSGTGPLALDAERNRLYVANGSLIDVYDTARAAEGAPAPAFGARLHAAGSPLPTFFTIPGAAVRSVAVDPSSGSVWAVNDLGVHVVDPFLPGAPVVTLPVPPGLGATTHADRVVSMAVSGEMLVSLWDGAASPGTEGFLLFDVSTRLLLGFYPVGAMSASQATVGGAGVSLGSSTRQTVSDGTPNGNTSVSIVSNLLTSNRPAATGAVWNREFAVQPSSGGSGRVFLLFENTGPITGTVVAANGTNALVNGVPAGVASGVELSLPLDWVHVLDLTTGGSTIGTGVTGGAFPLGINVLSGPGDGERGAIAYDATRGVVVVHGAATGGSGGFTFVNTSNAGFAVPPTGPPYSAGSFGVPSAALAAMINNALTPGTAINTPSAVQSGVIPTQEHLRVLTAPGAVSTNTAPGNLSVVPPVLRAHATLGAPRGSPQRTADLILCDGVAGAPDGTWYLFGAPADADLTECDFDGTTVTSTTAVGAAPLPSGPTSPKAAATSP